MTSTPPPTRQLASSGSPFEATIGFSRAVRDGEVVAVSGTAPVWPDGHVDPDPVVQTRRCWEIALAALAQLGGTPADVVDGVKLASAPSQGVGIYAVLKEAPASLYFPAISR